MSLFTRAAGVLLHPTSLPETPGNGDLGPAARAWVELLAGAGQSLWQVLPLGPTGYGDSPYQSHSSFAGNVLLVSLDDLAAEGWLEPVELTGAPPPPAADQCDFGAAADWRRERLARAAARFRLRATGADRAAFEVFRATHRHWLQDWCRYAVWKRRAGGREWLAWPEPWRNREPAALAELDREAADELADEAIVQYFFTRQWRRLHDHATARGVTLIGDLPIFVAADSADVWAHPELFRLHTDGRPAVIAGVPPDYFSPTGQRWGNPLYDWERHAADDFAWWRARLDHLLAMVDVVRLDHFRGLVACWEIPGDHPTAEHGKWVPAPGRALLESVRRHRGGRGIPIIAEDLGVITPEVTALRDDFGLPGLRILQFAFGTDPMRHTFVPSAYIPDCVAYTGTHDNDTWRGWFDDDGSSSQRTAEEIAAERAGALALLGGDGVDSHRRAIVALLESVAGAAIYPWADVAGLGTRARMNRPGTASGNWAWRLPAWPDEAHWSWLREATAAAGRMPASAHAVPFSNTP